MAVAEKHVVGEEYNLLTTFMNTEGSHKGVGSAGSTGSKGLGWELGVSSGTGLRECETNLNNC
jgi:hypothetical protein